jgi:outer membrane protein assembly factor BamB
VVSQVATTGREVLVTAQDKDGTLEGTALDAASGKVLWQHANTPADGIAGVGILPPMPVERSSGWLAVQVEGTGGQIALGDRYAYVARDSRTGKQVWRHPVSDTSTYSKCGNLFCFDTLDADYAGKLVAVDPETGRTRWSYATPVQFTVLSTDASTITIETLGKGTTVVELDAATGKVQWKAMGDAALGSGATTDGGWNGGTWGDVVISDLDAERPTDPAGTFAIDKRTGKRLWTAKGAHLPVEFLVGLGGVNSYGNAIGRGPLVLERSTFTATSYEVQALEGVDLHTGKVLWTIPAPISVDIKNDPFGSLPVGVVDASMTRAWVIGPKGSTSLGFEIATGSQVPVEGSGWAGVFSDTDGVRVPALKETFSAPLVLRHLTVPDKAVVAGGAPPSAYCATAGKVCAWLAGDGTLHGAPGH